MLWSHQAGQDPAGKMQPCSSQVTKSDEKWILKASSVDQVPWVVTTMQPPVGRAMAAGSGLSEAITGLVQPSPDREHLQWLNVGRIDVKYLPGLITPSSRKVVRTLQVNMVENKWRRTTTQQVHHIRILQSMITFNITEQQQTPTVLYNFASPKI